MAGEITQDMIATVRHRLADPGGQRYSEAEIISYLNESQRHVVDNLPDGALWALTRVQSITLVAGTSSYALDAAFLRQRRVLYKADDAVLWPIAEIRALRQNVHHEGSETNPYYVIWNGKTIEFFVSAVTQAGSEKAYVWYVATPTDVSLTADPELPNMFRNLIEQRAVATALMADPEVDFDAAEAEMDVFDFLCEIVKQHYGPVAPYGGLPNDPRPSEQKGV